MKWCIKCSKPLNECKCFDYSREQIIALLNENAELKIRLEEMKNTSILINENNALSNKLSLAGYRVAELKTQIEKMKCCWNCKASFANGSGCMLRARNIKCNNLDKWELKNEI